MSIYATQDTTVTHRDGLTSVQDYMALQRQARELPIHHEISPTAANVYRILASMANPHKHEGKFTCWPGMSYIGKCVAKSRSTVIRAIAELTRAGLVTKENRQSPEGDPDTNIYTLALTKNTMTLALVSRMTPKEIETRD